MKLPRRELRALSMVVQGGAVTWIDDALFVVRSASGAGSYELRWDQNHLRWSCDCPDAAKGTYPCKHVMVPRWTLALPVVLMANSGITSGASSRNPDPHMFYLGRQVRVCDAVELYRTAVSRLGGIQEAFPRRPPLPRLSRTLRSVGE